jgi:uncharacterized membrane protein
MYGWTILFAFITFISFISGLFTIAALVTGIVNRNRSLIDLGMKALIVTVVVIAIYYMLAWVLVKELALHLKTIFDPLLK